MIDTYFLTWAPFEDQHAGPEFFDSSFVGGGCGTMYYLFTDLHRSKPGGTPNTSFFARRTLLAYEASHLTTNGDHRQRDGSPCADVNRIMATPIGDPFSLQIERDTRGKSYRSQSIQSTIFCCR
jgi:hypothetical protein